MINVAIFDMDGTIIQTLHIWDKILGHFVGDTELERFRTLRSDFHGPQKGLYKTAQILRLHYGYIGQSDEEIIHTYQSIARAIINHNEINFVEGFQDFHSFCKQRGIITAIATNAPDYALQPLIHKMNLQNFFGEHIYNSCMVDATFKPDPALYRFVIKKLGINPDECICLEDTQKGILSAKTAGIHQVIDMRTYTYADARHMFDNGLLE